jgi:type IV pilus assembly protein PilM
MARRHTHVLGLDIGSKAIKAVELRRAGSDIEVVGRPTVVPTPERSVEGGVVVDTAAIAGALAEVLNTGGFKTRKVIASVGGDSSVVVRITEVPRMSGKELDEAIHWELDRQTPFPIDDTIWEYQVIEHPDADPSAPNMEVLLAVAQEDMLDAHVDAMHAAKLMPVAIDVEPLAISRAVVDVAGEAFRDQTVCIIHMGASATTIMIVRKGLLAFVRSVPTAGETLTQSIRQNFMNDDRLSELVKRQFADLSDGIYDQDASYGGGAAAPAQGDFAEPDGMDSVFEVSDGQGTLGGDEPFDAAATQIEMGAAPPAAATPAASSGGTQGAVPEGMGEEELAARQITYEAVAPTIVDLATEVRRSVDFYRRQHRNEEVDRVVLTGGSAAITGLASFVEAETGISTQVADPFSHLSGDGDEASRRYLQDIGPSMVVAVGLALRDLVE